MSYGHLFKAYMKKHGRCGASSQYWIAKEMVDFLRARVDVAESLVSSARNSRELYKASCQASRTYQRLRSARVLFAELSAIREGRDGY